MVKLDGYELIVGSSIDPQFGPVLLFGSGGQLVEVIKDRALALPPLNTTLARRMMEHTRILTALKGVRGRRPVDLQALEQLLVRFSRLVVERPWIKEIDINPLLASPERPAGARRAGDPARARSADEAISSPRHPAVSDPVRRTWTAKDGSTLLIRPDPSRGRTAPGRVPRDPLRANRLPPLLPCHEAEHAGRSRAADPDLFHRLRPRDGPGRRAQEPRGRPPRSWASAG